MSSLLQRIGQIIFWLIRPALYVYLKGSGRTRILVRSEGQVLLIKGWLSDGKWTIPGGGLHAGEECNDGAVRELFEEVGIHVDAQAIQLIASEPLRDHGLSFEVHYCVVDVPVQQKPQRQWYEISAAEWFDPAKLPKDMQPEVQRIFELLAEN